MKIRVDCYAGYRGEETPRQLTMGARHIAVVAVQDQWLSVDHRYFKIIGDDEGMYIIRHDPQLDVWQLTCFKSATTTNRPIIADSELIPPPVC